MNAGQLHVLKRDPSGEVLAGAATIGGQTVEIVLKRPRHKKWHRYVKELYNGLRARPVVDEGVVDDRARHPHRLAAVGHAAPRGYGDPAEAVIVSQRVQGDLLAKMDFDRLAPRDRMTLFHRLGRTLRLLERDGLLLYDSKAVNWVVIDDEKRGPTPVIVDVDGLRRWAPPLWADRPAAAELEGAPAIHAGRFQVGLLRLCTASKVGARRSVAGG
jgi:hypothetical protein